MLVSRIIFLLTAFIMFFISHATAADWPVFGSNLKRTGYSADQVDPPTGSTRHEAEWVRDFFTGDADTAELIANNCQPIVVGNLVFVATLRNRVHALNTDNGNINWTTQLPEDGMVFATPAVMGTTLYVASTNGYIYLLNINTGSIITSREISQVGGFRSSPAPTPNHVFLGGEDGYFYALNPSTGAITWRYKSGAPIISSPAVDLDYGRVYFSNEGMYGYALDFDGNLIWRTAKFHGTSTRHYYPVIVGGGASAKVIFRTAPGISERALQGGDSVLARAAGLTVPEFLRVDFYNPPSGFNLNAEPGIGDLQNEVASIMQFLSDYPEYKTFYAINASDGSEGANLPVLWTNGAGEVGEPPVVAADGTVYVKSRSYYSDFDGPSWYLFCTPAILNVYLGTMSLVNGSADPWETGFFVIGDEADAPVMGSNRLYYLSHGDSVGGMLLSNGTASGGRITVGRDYPHNISYQSNPDRRNYVPFGQGNVGDVRWIGGAGGGTSPNGLGISIGHNKLFYVSQGMLGMYEQNGGSMNYLHRTWSEPNYGNVSVPTLSALEPYVTTPAPVPQSVPPTLREKIEAEIDDIMTNVLTSGWNNSTHYQPFLFPNGKGRPGIYFTDPTEEAYVLGLVYPLVSDSMKANIITYVNVLFNRLNPLTDSFSYTSLDGRRRERYDINNDVGRQILEGERRADTHEYQTRIYNLWTYAHYTGDWSWVESNWSSIQSQIPTSGGSNSDVANMIGGYRIAVHMGVPSATLLRNAASGLRSRLQWESSNYPPVAWMEQRNTNAFCNTDWANGGEIARYHGITYEVGRALKDYASIPMNVQDKFLRSSLPGQIVTEGWYPNRGEGFSNRPHQQRDAWVQKAFIMQLPGHDLKAYLSSSWCKGDLYYIERLAWTSIAATIPAPPQNLRLTSSTQ